METSLSGLRRETAWLPRMATTTARWLMIAILLDLVVTRFALRAAIFVPKDPAVAEVVAVTARLGAVVENLVALLALLLLVALTVAQARARSSVALRGGLVLTGAVAAAGIGLLAWPASPAAAIVAWSLTLAAAASLGAATRGLPGMPLAVPLALLAAAIGLPAGARVIEALAAAIPGAGAADLAADLAAGLSAAGQLCFVAGAILAGLLGLRTAWRDGSRRPIGQLAVGLAVAGVLLIFAAVRPAELNLLLIWSVGFALDVPPLVVALVTGLAVAGIAALARRNSATATGMAIVLAAGTGLAASSLLLAGLLGLAVAAGAAVASDPVTQ